MARQYTDMPLADTMLLEKLKFNWAHHEDADRFADTNRGCYYGYVALASFVGALLLYTATPARAETPAEACRRDDVLGALSQTLNKMDPFAVLGLATFEPVFTGATGRAKPDGTYACMVTLTYNEPRQQSLRTTVANGQAGAATRLTGSQDMERQRRNGVPISDAMIQNQRRMEENDARQYAAILSQPMQRMQATLRFSVEPMEGDYLVQLDR